MFCKNCGTKINDDEKFCEKCKKEISEANEKMFVKNDTIEKKITQNSDNEKDVLEENHRESTDEKYSNNRNTFEEKIDSKDIEREDLEEYRKYENFNDKSEKINNGNHQKDDLNVIENSTLENKFEIINTNEKVEDESEENVLLEIHPTFAKPKRLIKKTFLFVIILSAIFISHIVIRENKNKLEIYRNAETTVITFDGPGEINIISGDEAKKYSQNQIKKGIGTEIFGILIRVGIDWFLIMGAVYLYRSNEYKRTSYIFLKNKLKYKQGFEKEKEINYSEILYIVPKKDDKKNSGDSGQIIIETKVDKKLAKKEQRNNRAVIITIIMIVICSRFIDEYALTFIVCMAMVYGAILSIPFLIIRSVIVESRRTLTRIYMNNIENVEETYNKIKAIVEGKTNDI